MAKIIKGKNDLEQDYQELLKYNKKWTTILIISGIFFLLTAGFTLPVVLLSVYKLAKKSEETRIIKSGVEGEKNTLELLKKLPDDYTIINDVTVEYEGKSSQLDHIVIGSNGVFVIETKNMNGMIGGTETDKMWRQSKVGRGGTAYGKDFYSPLKQVGTHVYRLSNYLRENKSKVWIQGMVYFANPEAGGFIDRTSNENYMPVHFAKDHSGEDLLKYITSYNKETLSEGKQKRIVQLLSQ